MVRGQMGQVARGSNFMKGRADSKRRNKRSSYVFFNSTFSNGFNKVIRIINSFFGKLGPDFLYPSPDLTLSGLTISVDLNTLV